MQRPLYNLVHAIRGCSQAGMALYGHPLSLHPKHVSFHPFLHHGNQVNQWCFCLTSNKVSTWSLHGLLQLPLSSCVIRDYTSAGLHFLGLSAYAGLCMIWICVLGLSTSDYGWLLQKDLCLHHHETLTEWLSKFGEMSRNWDESKNSGTRFICPGIGKDQHKPGKTRGV